MYLRKFPMGYILNIVLIFLLNNKQYVLYFIKKNTNLSEKFKRHSFIMCSIKCSKYSIK